MITSTRKFSKFIIGGTVRAVAILLVLVSYATSATFAQTHAYVANLFDSTVSVIDVATNTVVATLPLANAGSISVTPDGAFAYVGTANTVTVIDTTTNTVVAIVPVGPGPHTTAFTPNGAVAYVSNGHGASNTVSVIDTATNTVIATVTVGFAPWGIAITPNGAFAYVTNFSSDTVSIIDTTTNTVIATIPVGDGPTAIAFVTRRQTDPIDSLTAQVQALITQGSLTENQAAGLIDKLQHIQTKIHNGQTGAACNQLSAFINQVNAFIHSGSLTASQGQALINGANAIKASLGC